MKLATFIRDERGAVLILAAFMLPVVVGLAAFTVDLSNAYSVQGRLQNAADAAALIAAHEYLQSNEAEARVVALDLAYKNVKHSDGQIAEGTDIVFGHYDAGTRRFTPGLKPYTAVKVATHRDAERGNAVQTYFAAIFNVKTFDLSREAIAAIVKPSTCIYALDPTKAGSFSAGGTSQVHVPDCGIQVNSGDSSAMSVGGSSSVIAQHICIKGGYLGENISPTPETNCSLNPDPLASVPEPTPPSSCYMEDVEILTPMVLPPDIKLCGKIAIKAAVTFQPGVVYFENASFVLEGNGSVLGIEAVLFFDEFSTFSLKSKLDVTLMAPESGPYKGIAIFRSRAGKPTKSVITGARSLVITGAIYGTTLDLELDGSSSVEVLELSYIITNTIKTVGTAMIVMDVYRGPLPATLTKPTLVY